MPTSRAKAKRSEPKSVAAAVRQAEREHRPVRIPGHRVAAVPLSVLRRLERAAEDALDNRLMDEALAESDERIPYEKVRRELGLE